ncbi:MAG: hypothetical protein ACI4IJ_10085 [Acutalibacteraceae bacterium]
MFGRKTKEHKEIITAEEIRRIREQERINSVSPEKSYEKEKIKIVLKYAAVTAVAAVLFVLFFLLSGFLSSVSGVIIGYLSVIDDSSGFLFEFVNKLIYLAAAAIVTLLFGFSLKKIRGEKKRGNIEGDFKWIGICTAAALVTDVLFLLISRITGASQLIVSGSVLSQIMYYLTKIMIVPLSNIIFYVVLPSMLLEFASSLFFNSRAEIRIPLMIFSTVMLAAGQLGMSWAGISGAGFMITLYALIQSGVCSVVYHRTQRIWLPILIYALVTALYYPLSGLLYLI